jgi:hypothetical protein
LLSRGRGHVGSDRCRRLARRLKTQLARACQRRELSRAGGGWRNPSPPRRGRLGLGSLGASGSSRRRQRRESRRQAGRAGDQPASRLGNSVQRYVPPQQGGISAGVSKRWALFAGHMSEYWSRP